MMNGMKFILRRTFGRWALWVFPLLFGAATLLLAIFEPGEKGSSDYFISRLMGSSMGTVMFSTFMGMSLSADLTGNRCMRSAPIAKSLITRDVPLFFTALTALCSLAASVIYTACILGGGGELSDAADFVIISACADFVCTIIAAVAVNIRYGFILMIYIYLPFFLSMLFVPKSVKLNGFGLSLGAAAGIFAAAALLSVLAAMPVSAALYKKLSFRPYVSSAELSGR